MSKAVRGAPLRASLVALALTAAVAAPPTPRLLQVLRDGSSTTPPLAAGPTP